MAGVNFSGMTAKGEVMLNKQIQQNALIADYTDWGPDLSNCPFFIIKIVSSKPYLQKNPA
jgi:hypothetical protein